MKIKGAIFDLDGTLLDSMSIWENLGADYLKSFGIKPSPDIREVLRPMSLLQSAEYFRKNYGIPASVEEIMGGINSMIEHYYLNTVPIKSGVDKFLAKLKKKHVKMCVATATDRYLTEAALKRNGINTYFERIFTCSEVGKGKDSPDIFLYAREFLGTDKNETFVFEDALYAVKTAENAGFPVVAVYDSSAELQQEEIKASSNIYLKSYDEWCDF